MTRYSAALLGLGALFSGCVQYNDRCKGFVANPDATVGYIGAQAVFIDKANARHANNALGQLAADAFLSAEYADGQRPDFAAYNGGGVRSEGLCVTHNILPAGSAVSSGLLHEIFLFNNLVLSVQVTGKELLDTMEASVKNLVAAPPISDPSGDFLQIGGGEGTVDCAQPAGAGRVTRLVVGGKDLVLPENQALTFRFASINFLFSADGALTPALEGADREATRSPAQATQLGGIDSNLIQRFFAANHGDAARGLTLDQTHGAAGTSPRLELLNCAQPTRPSE